jgi:hypothetical protein
MAYASQPLQRNLCRCSHIESMAYASLILAEKWYFFSMSCRLAPPDSFWYDEQVRTIAAAGTVFASL